MPNPQHGSGPDMRRIVLLDWQSQLVASHVEPFIRGLIHSDGTRIVATERKGNHVRQAARYAFRNRSEDILRIFGTRVLAQVFIARAPARRESPSTAKPRSLVSMSSLVEELRCHARRAESLSLLPERGCHVA
jgi:hypothetical protein